MKEFKVILKYADENSIILGDELFKGTQADDATALVASALEILSLRKSNFIFATHLHNLTMMDNIKNLKNIKMCHLLVERDISKPCSLIYSRKLYDGSGPSSYGILVCEAMNIDDNFTKRANEIRKTLCDNLIKINNIGSKYNKDKVIAECEVCKEANACDVHHINQQCDADNCDLIDDIEIGIFNKNKLWNLVSLCKKCHQSVHSSPPRLKIDGYINTSNGVRLVFERLDKECEVEIEVEVDAGGNSDREIDVVVNEGFDNELGLNNEVMIHTNDSKKKTGKGGNSNYGELSDEVRDKILEMKKNNTTPKKIQFDMMRYHQLKISQQAIRDLHCK
jgi:DNA mismatch repair protein MutS